MRFYAHRISRYAIYVVLKLIAPSIIVVGPYSVMHVPRGRVPLCINALMQIFDAAESSDETLTLEYNDAPRTEICFKLSFSLQRNATKHPLCRQIKRTILTVTPSFLPIVRHICAVRVNYDVPRHLPSLPTDFYPPLHPPPRLTWWHQLLRGAM